MKLVAGVQSVPVMRKSLRAPVKRTSKPNPVLESGDRLARSEGMDKDGVPAIWSVSLERAQFQIQGDCPGCPCPLGDTCFIECAEHLYSNGWTNGRPL